VLGDAYAVTFPRRPEWSSAYAVRLEDRTLRLLDFGAVDGPSGRLPVIVIAPFAGHLSTIVDFAQGRSVVQALRASGCGPVFATDWRSASRGMRAYGIDDYVFDLSESVDTLGGRAHLVGLSQGGWLAVMLAARFPEKVASLVLAGAPIDTQVGDGPMLRRSRRVPMWVYRWMVAMGSGRMRGANLLSAWKSLDLGRHYLEKYSELVRRRADRVHVADVRRFARWYETTADLPGRFYLDVVLQLFKMNRLARSQFTALGKRLWLKSIRVPTYLLAASDDEITPKEQVLATAGLIGTPTALIVSEIVPGTHFDLFADPHLTGDVWPRIGTWIGNLSAR
jgi:poly(3-hydroxybutyrate) depolymerase